MKQSDVVKLNQILQNNQKWPLIIEGGNSSDFQGGLILPADMQAQELYQTPSRQQEWTARLEQMNALQGGALLVIAGLDEISTEEQEKFLGLVKERAVGQYRLPDGVRILIPVQSRGRVNQKIQRASLFWEIGQEA